MVIIYKQIDNSIAIIRPSQEALSFFTYAQIAEKDVPAGLPYWILESSEVLRDRIFRNAWEADSAWGEPHGFGGESEQFDEELLRQWRIFTGK